MPTRNIGVKATAEKTESVGNANQVDDIIKRAQAVVARLEHNLSWDVDWRSLILALGLGRTTAMREAAINEPKGYKYQNSIRAFLCRHGFDGIHKADRCRLFECHFHLDEINAWRSALPAEEQQTLNHPRVVLAGWKRSLNKPPDPKKKATIALGDLSPEERAQLIADTSQHIVAQERQLAERQRAALTKLVNGVRGALLTSAPAKHQLETIKALIDEFDDRAARTTDWRDRIAPESRYRMAADKPGQETLLKRIGRGNAPTNPAPVVAPSGPTKH